MKILDRYLIKNFLLPLLYCLFLFCFLYVIVDIFGHLDEILKNKVPLAMLVKYYSSFIPLIFVQTTPIAALLSIVYMMSVFNKNNELTAAKACGISIMRLLLPVFAIGVVLSLFSFLVNENVVPKSIVTANKIKSDYIEKSPDRQKNIKLINDLTVYGKDNQLIYSKEFDLTKNTLKDIIIMERDKSQRLRRKILAQKAIWNGSDWVFSNCVIYRFDTTGKSSGNPLIFNEKILNLTDTPKELLRYEFQTGYMGYKELTNYINRLKDEDTKILKSLKTDLYFKSAMPFICIIIMLLGVPFALTTRRGSAMAGIGISVLVGLFYYGSIYIVLAMGKGGLLPPFVAAHLPNVVFSIIAVYLLKKSPM